jgi:hypothetical protein
MSEAGREPYRAAAGASGTSSGRSLVLHYVCVPSWTAVVGLLIFASLFAWVISSETLDKALRLAPGAVAFLALISVTRFPLVTLRARVEGGHLVVSGRRWPGAESMWSCTLAEATGFVEQAVETDGERRPRWMGTSYRRVALRTADDQVLGLTHVAYSAIRWPHPRVVARLNDWLAAQKAGC